MPAPVVSSGQMQQVARSLLVRNARVKPGENVTVEGFSHTLDWAVVLAREARRLGAHPLVLHEDEEAYWEAVERHQDGLLGAEPAHEWAALSKTDVYFHMWGIGDRLRLAALPPARQERLTAFNIHWYQAAQKADLRGFRLELGRPFPNLARAYGVSERAWMDQVLAGTLVDPAHLKAAARPIAAALERGRRIRIHDDRGTDLTLGLRHRAARVFWGGVSKPEKREMFTRLQTVPSGSIRVALDESVADGQFVANRTSYIDVGTATGGTFEFQKGRLVGHGFRRGGQLFEEGFAKGGKGRDRPGMLILGLNPRLRDTPQLEDVERGALTVAVGGNQFLGGKNRSPFFGFAVNAGARLEIDGRRVPGFG